MSSEKILVSWVAFNNDPFRRDRDGRTDVRHGDPTPGPSMELLGNPASRYSKEIAQAYFLVRDSPPDEHPRAHAATEIEVFNELRAALAERRPRLGVEAIRWTTSDAPTAFRPIFRFTVTTLRDIRRRHPRATIVVNISPGTPAMQMVMLVALQARAGGEPIEVVQGVPPDKRPTPEVIFEPVPWNLIGELNALDAAASAPPSARTGTWSIMDARSKPLQQVAQQIERVGRLPFPVLIVGSRGSGKTEVARLVRARHLEARVRVPPADDWRFRINCAALPDQLIESELFGHEKGAFTDAKDMKRGLLEQAAGDCVFLDEVHHLSRPAQAKLLVALQRNGEFRRVGGSTPIRSEFRLIAASNRSRDELARGPELLSDLFDRIRDFIIAVPDLSVCRDDLGSIWEQTVREAAAEVATALKVQGRAEHFYDEVQSHRDEVLRALRRLLLPGNWRDLQRLARRLLATGLNPALATIVLSRDKVKAELVELEREERGTDPSPPTGTLADELPTLDRCADAARDAESRGATVPLDQLVSEWERRLIEGTLRIARSERQAATVLGINPRTLNARRKRLASR